MADAKIEVFTSPTCPYCPGALKAARQIAKERPEVKVVETSTGLPKGSKRAESLGVRSVPTLFITGSGYANRIGYVGIPSNGQLNRMVNIAIGKEQWEEKKSEGLFGFLKKIKI